MKIRNRFIITEENIGSVPCLLCFALILYVRIFSLNNTTLLLQNVLIIIAGIIGISILVKNKSTKSIFYLAFILIAWLIQYLIRFDRWSYSPEDIINTICFLGIGFILTKTKKCYKWYKLLFYGISAYFLLQIIIFNRSFRTILPEGTTYNYISVFELIFFSIMLVSGMKNGIKPGWLESIVFFVVCLISYGRSGIACAFIYLILYALLRLYETRKKAWTYFVVIIFAVALYIGIRAYLPVIESRYLMKFTIYAMDSNGRTDIWGRFLTGCFSNPVDFIIGSDPTLAFTDDGNLHNSLLMMWSSLGFLFFLINIILISKIVIKNCRMKNYYYLLIFVTFIIRASFDKLMFRWYGEIVYFYFIFDYFAIRNTDDYESIEVH